LKQTVIYSTQLWVIGATNLVGVRVPLIKNELFKRVANVIVRQQNLQRIIINTFTKILPFR